MILVVQEVYSEPVLPMIRSFLAFYQPLCPSLVVLAVTFGWLFGFAAAGWAYLAFSPLIHYIVYEVRKPHQYPFYRNLGWSKPGLWLTNLSVGCFVAIILIAL